MSDEQRGFAYKIALTGRLEPLVGEAVAALARGDTPAYLALLSPSLRRDYGDEAISETVELDFIPYFAGCVETGGPITVMSAADPYGNEGLSFYKFAVTEDGERRPFAIWIVEEKGQPVVAGLLPNITFEQRAAQE